MERVDAANPWIVEADAAPRRALGWLTAMVGALWAAGVVHWSTRPLEGWLAGLGDPGDPWTFDLQTLVLNGVVFGLMLAAAAVGGRVEGRRVARLGRRPLWAALTGVAIGVVGFSLSLGVAFLAGAVIRGTGPALSVSLLGPALANMLLILLGALAEEVYFRGWLQPVLCGRWGAWVGLTATSLIFAAAHLIGAPRSPTAMLNIVLAGTVFGLLALRSGGLAAPVMAHFAWNWSEAGLFGADPNPGGDPVGAVADVDLSGPTLWSGGADTMNGSLATTLVLAVLVLLAALARPRGAPARATQQA
ncbi:CPBP family intramembrane glutamic endopeptidase [Caulobacter sp. KR2-114]|uniref:CPBP family intramembrane glutamic endopeptidase n=1 Tax=Caulobacter sp. KR2-114 TaxID=3400912 RepID=UPI003C114A66